MPSIRELKAGIAALDRVIEAQQERICELKHLVTELEAEKARIRIELQDAEEHASLRRSNASNP